MHLWLPPFSCTETTTVILGGMPLKMGINFWRVGSLCYRLPPLGECSRTHLYQCTSWHCGERLHLASVEFLKTFNVLVHFMMGDLWIHLLTPRWTFSNFGQKMAWPPCPTLPIHLISPWATFFCFLGWKRKSSKGNLLPMWKRWNKKTAEALKGIKIAKFNNCFEQWKEVSWEVHCIKWRVFWRWLKFVHVRIKTQVFINKFCFFWFFLVYSGLL